MNTPTPPDRPDFNDVEAAFKEIRDGLDGTTESDWFDSVNEELEENFGPAIKKAKRAAIKAALLSLLVALVAIAFFVGSLTAIVCGVLSLFGVI